MKRWITLLLVLALAMCGLSAQAEEEISRGLYQLMAETADGQSLSLGTAALVSSGEVLLGLAKAAPEGAALYVMDGENRLPIRGPLAEAASPFAAYALMEALPAPVFASAEETAGPLRCVWLDEAGKLTTREVQQAAPFQRGDTLSCILTLNQPCEIGAMVLNQRNQLAYVVLSVYGNSTNQYYAESPAQALAQLEGAYGAPVHTQPPAATAESTDAPAQAEAAKSTPAPAEPVLVKDPKITFDKGVTTVSWGGRRNQDEMAIALVKDTKTDGFRRYYSWDSNTSIQMRLVPGREYGIQVYVGKYSEIWQVHPGSDISAVFTTPESLYTDHSFTSETSLGIGRWGSTVEAGQLRTPVPRITKAMILELETYLNIVNTYQLEAEMDAPMLLVLLTPDNRCYSRSMTYHFDPELQERNAFSVSVTYLLQQSASEDMEFIKGTYELRYCIDGQWAGGIAFNLEE